MLPASAAITSIGLFTAAGAGSLSSVEPSSNTSIAWSWGASLPTWSTPIPTPATSTAPLILASSLPPVPAKLVDKIRAGKYVEMKELLSDNTTVLQSMEAVHPMLRGTNKPNLREVKSLLTWVYCFLAHVAISTPDAHTWDMLVHARLIIREARKLDGEGWRGYDSVFRANAAIAPSTLWTKLDSSLHAATLVANRTADGTFCTECQESDHTNSECAKVLDKAGMSGSKQQDDKHSPGSLRAVEDSRAGKWPTLPGKGKKLKSTPYIVPYKGTPGHICHSWN